MKKVVLAVLLCSALMGQELATSTVPNPPVFSKIQANRVGARQTEGKGIGYKKGYTTLQALVTACYNFDSFFHFADLRAHHFNDGKYTANAGIGLRYFDAPLNYLWGINGFFDYRQTSKVHYTQIGIGLEAIGARWVYRANGYIPICRRKSSPFDVKLERRPVKATYKREFAMGGMDAEVACLFFPLNNAEIEGALGPYYFRGRYNQHAVGGKGRLVLRFLDYISLEGMSSYDTLFKWTFQGQIGFTCPLGPRMKNRGIESSFLSLGRQLVRPVQRLEMIVVDRTRHSKFVNGINRNIQ